MRGTSVDERSEDRLQVAVCLPPELLLVETDGGDAEGPELEAGFEWGLRKATEIYQPAGAARELAQSRMSARIEHSDLHEPGF